MSPPYKKYKVPKDVEGNIYVDGENTALGTFKEDIDEGAFSGLSTHRIT
jgi:hypothetical protein